MNDVNPYQQLAEKIFLKDSVIIPQLFEMLADEKEAEVLLSLPATAEEVAEKAGINVDGSEDMLDVLFRKGLVFKKVKDEGVIYRLCRDLVQFHDATILWPDAPRTFLDLWQKYMEDEWPVYAAVVEKILEKPFSRIVPVNESIDATQRILAYEDVKEMIEGAKRIAVTNCTCRLIAQKCDRPLDVCLQLDRGADYSIERGTGRELSKEEAMQKIREAEEVGLIHMTMNRSENTNFICNCCDDCCQTFPLIISLGLHLCDPSRFRAQVNADLCTGCEDCLDHCFFGAIAMSDDDMAVVDSEKCMGCGLCKVACPEAAITLVEAREKDFIPT